MPFSSSNDGFTLKSHPHQLLKDHLEGVTIIATDIYASQNKNGGKQDIIRKICMAHDFGKATSFFFRNILHIMKRKKKESTGEKINTLGQIRIILFYLPFLHTGGFQKNTSFLVT